MEILRKRDVFRSVFKTNSYGCSGECHCGVQHYDAANEWDDDHEQSTLPLARKFAEEFPEKVQFRDNTIEFLEINGRMYVIGCRCGMGDFFFQWVEDQKQAVLSYYKQTKDALSVEDVE